MKEGLNIRVLFFSLYLISYFSYAQQLKIGAEEWPRFTNANGTGIYFKLLKRIYPKKKFDIRIDSYNRVLNSFHKNEIDIIVGVYREDVQQALIPDWFLDTEYPVTAFYDPTLTKINNVSDIDNKRISWKRGYHFEQFISDLDSKKIYLVNNTETGFELLNKNRVDVFIDYPKNIPNKYQQRFISLEIVPSRHIYLAFQKNKHGELLAKQFDKKMADLRSSGDLAKIFDNEYLHSDLDNFKSNLEHIIVITEDSNLSIQSKNLDQGSIESKIINLIQAKLENYNIEFKILLSLENINQYSKEEKTCFNDMVKTAERAKNFIFSEPSSLYMGLRLYSKTDLHLSDSIELSSFLAARQNTKIGITRGQNYGSQIEEQLSNINQVQIVSMPVNRYSKYRMFKGGRFDYMLQYPEEITSNWPQIGGGKLYSYELKNVDKYVLGHMMCSKTNSSENFIRAYNKSLADTIHSGVFFDIQYRIVSKDSQKDFVKYFNDVFND